MRSSVRWVLASAGYALILFVAALVTFTLAWGCHHRPRVAEDLLCTITSPPFGRVLILGILVASHAGATVLAILVVPSRQRVVGAVAVLAPLLFFALSMWGQTAVSRNYFSDLVAPVLLAVPGALCAILVVRQKERRVA
jgi:hypothetical protein